MRVIAGQYGGRHLQAVNGHKTRPTTDKVKEAMFNMIMPYFSDGQVLDLFAGTGGLGIEAVSRGSRRAVLVDRQRHAQKVIRENIAVTKEPERFSLYSISAQAALTKLAADKEKFALVFLDPPYRFKIISDLLQSLADRDLLTEQAIIVSETDEIEQHWPESFKLLKQHHYGSSYVSVYQYG